MDGYKCPIDDLPKTLYRVDYPDHPGSRTSSPVEEGFVARDTTKIFGPGEVNDFKRAIENHFTWHCRNPSPFISLFSDREHAESWGLQEPWQGNESLDRRWALYAIDTAKLNDPGNLTACIFKLSDLEKSLDLNIPERVREHIQGTFICLHHIPASAIIQKITPEEIDRDRWNRMAARDYLEEYSDSEDDEMQATTLS